MIDKIRTNVENLVLDLSSKKISKLKKLIEEKKISKKTNLFELRSKLNLTSEETTTVKNVLDSFDDLNGVLLSIDLITEIHKLQDLNEKSHSLVWTSPFVFNEDADNTKTTLLDMIDSAKKSIIIVGYTIERDTKEIFAALEHASQKGVAIKLLFDNAEKFAQWLLEEFDFNNETLMVAPAAGFYSTKGEGYNQVRIAYVLNQESLQKAINCLEEALKLYPGRI